MVLLLKSGASGIVDPYGLYKHIHLSELVRVREGGIGDMTGLQRMFFAGRSRMTSTKDVSFTYLPGRTSLTPR